MIEAIFNILLMPLLIGLIIFIGVFFKDLSKKYNKSPWLYVPLGIITFFIGEGIGVLLSNFIKTSHPTSQVTSYVDLLHLVFVIGLGIGLCLLLHNWLRRRWSRE